MNRLLWVDLEMTGLDVEKEVIIEVAAIVTDLHLKELDNYHAVIQQPQKYLNNMDEWNQTHHKESGLLEQIPHGKKEDDAEKELIQLVDKHFGDEPAVLAGNSIGQDRLFINKYLEELAAKLHYRMLDVTAWKLVFENLYNVTFDKESRHRALDDVRDSIEELNLYLQYINASPQIY